jgi:hypothetical protein
MRERRGSKDRVEIDRELAMRRRGGEFRDAAFRLF